jgi:predicted nucleic acid-binding Zn ribbon protein
MNSKTPEKFGGLLHQMLDSMGLGARLREFELMSLWDDVVGEQLSGAARPEFIKNGRMFVVTKNSVWSNELNLYKGDIISRLNKKMGSPVLKDIIFKAGSLPARPVSVEEEPKGPSPEEITLSEEEMLKVEEMAAKAGTDAGEDVKRLLISSAKLDKWKRESGWTPCKKCGVLHKGGRPICPICEVDGW